MKSSKVVAEAVCEDIRAAIGFFDESDPHTAIRHIAALTTKRYAKMLNSSREYVGAQASRLRKGFEVDTPETFFRAKELDAVVFDPAPSTDLTYNRIYKAILSQSAILPTSTSIASLFNIRLNSAATLRKNCMAVLKALDELGLYKHPAYDNTVKYSRRRKKSK